MPRGGWSASSQRIRCGRGRPSAHADPCRTQLPVGDGRWERSGLDPHVSDQARGGDGEARFSSLVDHSGTGSIVVARVPRLSRTVAPRSRGKWFGPVAATPSRFSDAAHDWQTAYSGGAHTVWNRTKPLDAVKRGNSKVPMRVPSVRLCQVPVENQEPVQVKS